MTQQGVVIALQGDQALVEFERSEACARCGACGMGKGKTVQVSMPNTLGAQTGDRVLVQLHSQKVVKATAIVYLFPLLAFLFGLWVAPRFYAAWGVTMESELFSCVTALLFLAVAFALVRLTDKRRMTSGEFAPVMMDLVSEVEEGGN